MTINHTTDRMCPKCAETIKLKAISCRFCGLDIAKFEAAEVKKQRLAANRIRNSKLGQKIVDQAIFRYAEYRLNLIVGAKSLHLLRGQTLFYIDALARLEMDVEEMESEAGKPLPKAVDVSFERMQIRAKALGMVVEEKSAALKHHEWIRPRGTSLADSTPNLPSSTPQSSQYGVLQGPANCIGGCF